MNFLDKWDVAPVQGKPIRFCWPSDIPT